MNSSVSKINNSNTFSASTSVGNNDLKESSKEPKKLNLIPSGLTFHTTEEYLKANKRYVDIENNREQLKLKVGEPFKSTGKFIQVTAQFSLFDKRINSLNDTLYSNMKKCLTLKGSLQDNHNFLKSTSNSLIQNFVNKIFEINKLFQEGPIEQQKVRNEILGELDKISAEQKNMRHELDTCEFMLNHCENEIGYKMMENKNYSFMRINDYNLTVQNDRNKRLIEKLKET